MTKKLFHATLSKSNRALYTNETIDRILVAKASAVNNESICLQLLRYPVHTVSLPPLILASFGMAKRFVRKPATVKLKLQGSTVGRHAAKQWSHLYWSLYIGICNTLRRYNLGFP